MKRKKKVHRHRFRCQACIKAGKSDFEARWCGIFGKPRCEDYSCKCGAKSR